MRVVVIISALISLGLLGFGLFYYLTDNLLYHKFFGFGTLSLFFVTFPLILIWRRNKFNLEKYTWNNNARRNFPDKNKKTED